MLNNIDLIKHYLMLDKKVSNFSLNKYLDDENVLKEKITELVKKTIKKKYLKFISINFWTYTSFFNEKLYDMSFEINLNYNINLFKISLSSLGYTKTKVKTLFDTSFSNDYFIKTNNKEINEFISLFKEIENKLSLEINKIYNKEGENYQFLLSNTQEKKETLKTILDNTVFKNIDMNKLNSLINEFLDFKDINDYDLNVYLSKDISSKSKKGDVVISFYLTPKNILKDSICLSHITFNINDLTFNVENRLLTNSKYLKKLLDIKKKEKLINDYLLSLIKS